MINIPKHLQTILQRAAFKAMPGLTESMAVTAEKNKEWDYTCASAMKFFNQFKKQGSFGFSTCQDLAKAICENVDPATNDAIDKIDLA
jgi:hypothetical protein